MIDISNSLRVITLTSITHTHTQTQTHPQTLLKTVPHYHLRYAGGRLTVGLTTRHFIDWHILLAHHGDVATVTARH